MRPQAGLVEKEGDSSFGSAPSEMVLSEVTLLRRER
jgi:hypothetical protein